MPKQVATTRRDQFRQRLGAVAGGIAMGFLITACGGADSEVGASTTAAADTTPVVPVPSPVPQPPPQPVDGALSVAEIAGLKFMREEEKLAHDVYVAMMTRRGQRVFGNIADSETVHTEAVLALLTQHGLSDPAAGKPAGDFEDAGLQTLYDALVASGAASLIDGLKVGALIEETDIRDIELHKAATDEPDILGVYDNLLCGSRNHLRAFNGALLAQGLAYVAQVIPQAQWDAIAGGTNEACGR